MMAQGISYYLLAAVALTCFGSGIDAQQGIGLTLNGVQYTNNSVVNITDIGTGSAALNCTTTYSPCCFSGPPPGNHWYFPNGSQVENTNTLPYYRSRGDASPLNPGRIGAVILHHNPEGTTTGVFRCEILDANEIFQSIYVGIYTATTGSPSVTNLTVNSQSRTFTCTSTGGPANSVTWTRDGAVITLNATHQQTKRIIDNSASTYQTVLTISQSVGQNDIPGLYSCTVENARERSSRAVVVPGNGMRFILRGTTYQNNSIVTLEDIGEGDDVLRCLTDLTACCRSPYTDSIGPSAVGNWFFPNGSRVPSIEARWDFHRTRGQSAVFLHRRQGGEEGIYSCVIPNATGVDQTIYIGVYRRTNTQAGQITIPDDITFQLEDADPLVFTLTCTSTGGPVSTVSWRRGGTMLSDDSTYNITSEVTDGTTSTYTHTLTVTGRLEGQYQCSVSNIRTPSESRSLTVNAPPDPPTGLNATQEGPTNIGVSWTAPVSGAAVTGYRIFYSGGTDQGSVDVGASVTEHTITVTPTQSRLTYSISIVTLSSQLPSSVLGPIMVTVGSDPITTQTDTPATISTSSDSTTFQTTSQTTPRTTSQTDTPNPTNGRNTLTTPNTRPTAAGSGAGGIVGGIIGALIAVALIVVIVILVVCLWRRYYPRDKYATTTTTAAAPKPQPMRFTKLAQNGEGEKTVEPVIEEFPQDIHVTEGETVALTVRVSGQPQPTLHWYHEGNKVVADYATEIEEDGSLTIPSAEPRHTGIYQLVAENSAGSMEKEVKVFVHVDGEATPAVQKRLMVLQAVPIANFGRFVADNHSNNNRGFRDQYATIEAGEEFPATIATTPKTRPLNRFANITVYDHNRIALAPIPGHDDCQRDYINACYIDGYSIPKKFIATQGPLPKTVTDFWRLVWQERPMSIVMVTNVKEGNKIKCQHYWPDSGNKNYGPFQVTITDQQTFADYTIRTFQMALPGSSGHRPFSITQYHFTAWPDHGVPDYATPILAFHRRVKSKHNPRQGPLLVHCSAGVGRTGTFITIDNVLEQVSKEGMVDISGTVIKIRQQRMKMVQTVEQYVFVHDAILESLTCGDTQITPADVRTQITKLEQRDSKTRMTGFESQFKVLHQVSPKPDEVRRETALQYPHRNRSMDYLPADRWRVLLKGEHPDYIHAVFVNGYKQQKAFIITQGPMDTTTRDFWKMVYDRKCGAIVMLSKLSENVCYQYWPTSGVQKIGEYTIDLIGEENLEGFVIRTLSVVEGKSGKAHQVSQFHIVNWNADGRCSNLKTVTDVIEEVTKVQMRSGNNPIVVHCSDTVSRSGMFCAIATTIERCKTEGVVDIFQVVKALRVQKPGAILNVEQYKVVFQAVLTFLDSFDTYANFQNI